MNIAVLGTGSVGQTLSAKLVQLGHKVVMGTRKVGEAQSRTTKDGYGNPGIGEWIKSNPAVKLATFAEAIAFGQLIINATMGGKSIAALKAGKSGDLAGKIIVDLANPLDFSKGMPPVLIPELCNTTSLGEEIQKAFPQSYVVKTLNTMWCGLMVNPSMVGGGDHHNFISGNNPEAKFEVRKLLSQFGWKDEKLLDLGDITSSRGTELILPIWLRVMSVKQNGAFNFKVVS
jgi:8-hydroxy-5-deazaflavin:NADPH oxidoreductase